MSRIGKRPVAVPKDVQINLMDGKISVKGPKGTLERVLPNGVVGAVKDGLWEWDMRTGALHWDARCYEMLGHVEAACR